MRTKRRASLATGERRAWHSCLLVCLFLTMTGLCPPAINSALAGSQNSFKKTDYKKERKRLLRIAERYLKRYPERRKDLLPDPIGELTDPVPVTYRIKDVTDGTSNTLLDPPETILIGLGSSLAAGRDRDNLVELYERTYDALPARHRDGLPRPELVRNLPLNKIRRLYFRMMKRVVERWAEITDEIKPGVRLAQDMSDNPIGECSSEIGYDYGGPDAETPARCLVVGYSPQGLMKETDFPLKDALTCVKDQFRRGTCTAHAIAAAVETIEMAASGTAENLSEQHIYFEAETETDSGTGGMYKYGVSVTFTVDHMVNSGYQIQYEEAWKYNRSPSIQSPKVGQDNVIVYPSSCTNNYWDDPCTKYAYQAETIFFGPGHGEPIGPAMPPVGAHRLLSDGVLLLEPFLSYGPSLRTAILLLAADVPLIATISATDGFLNTGDNGYVRYKDGDPVVGAHALTLVGFVPNSELPASVDPAVEEGYFVAKNSWGVDSGDCGFYYVDFAYLRYHGFNLVTLTAN